MLRTIGAVLATALTLALLSACGGNDDAAVGVNDGQLKFNASAYTTLNVTIDGIAVPVRWYKEVCYVAKPVAMRALNATQTNLACGWQSMNIYVRETAATDSDAAIYFAVNQAGWNSSYVAAGVADGATLSSASSIAGAALKAGYVFINVGSRGRNNVAADATLPGKSPAPVVDVKAAVRYLRLNDALMPGSANRIVVNGTSGGGGLVSIMGASGNSADYLPYLSEVGAAGIDSAGQSTLRDDVLAVVDYCPITDLGNADVMYEWLYTTLDTRALVSQNPNPVGSAELKARYAAYQTSLSLKGLDGNVLTSDSMMDEIRRQVIRSAEFYMAAGNTIPEYGQNFTYTSGTTTTSYVNDWITVNNATKKVVNVDMTRYLAFVARQAALKPSPSFDVTGLTVTGNAERESTMFGTSTQRYSNFTEYSWMHNDVSGDGIGRDDTGLTWSSFLALPTTVVAQQVKMMNPMAYIGTTATTAPYWYLRHGTRDRDTTFNVSINLSHALQADTDVKDLNYHLAWAQPHGGNYDVPEAMEWIAGVLRNGR